MSSPALPGEFAATLRAMHRTRDPRLPATIAAAHEQKWSYVIMGRALGVTPKRVGQISQKPHTKGPIDVPSPPEHQGEGEAPALTSEELARLEDSLIKEILAAREKEAADQAATQLEARVDAEVAAWRDRVEGGDLADEIRYLTLSDLEVKEEDFPGDVTLPWPARCMRCGATLEVILADPWPTCTHGGTPAPLSPEVKSAHRAVYQSWKDEGKATAAQTAGWNPAGPAPARDSTAWLLVCATCGRKVYVTVASGGHKRPCTHEVDLKVEAARERFAAVGWEVLEAPIPGDPRNRDKYSVRCMACKFETKRVGKKPVPCTHPHQNAPT